MMNANTAAWFKLGRQITDCLPGNASREHPSHEQLRAAADAVGITVADAERAHVVFNYRTDIRRAPPTPRRRMSAG